jgi:hypothetical protein
MRLDRIITKSKGQLQINKDSPVALFADSPVQEEGTPDYLFPSDHFGLVTDLQFIPFIKLNEETVAEQPANTCNIF